jgi:hypothetical protein
MRSWPLSISSLALMAACLAPVPAAAQDASVGGRGPRVHFHGRPAVSSGGQPVFVVLDEFAEFGRLAHLDSAPPLAIRVEGDVDVIVLPDGSLRFVLGGEDGGDEEE